MKLNYHKSHRGGQSQALHNVSFFNNLPDPSLWNSQIGRREFLGKIGKASVGTAIVLNGLKLDVMASNSDGSITIMFALPEQITGNNAGTAYTIKVGWSLMNTKEVDSPAADVAVTMVEFAFGTSSGVVWIPATVANAIVLSQDVVVPKNSTKKGAKVITVTAPNAPGGSTGVVLAVRTTTIFSPASNSPMTGQKTVE